MYTVQNYSILSEPYHQARGDATPTRVGGKPSASMEVGVRGARCLTTLSFGAGRFFISERSDCLIQRFISSAENLAGSTINQLVPLCTRNLANFPWLRQGSATQLQGGTEVSDADSSTHFTPLHKSAGER